MVATISTDFKNKSIIITGQHNHLPQEVNIQRSHLRRAISLKGTKIDSMNTTIKQIYNQEKAM